MVAPSWQAYVKSMASTELTGVLRIEFGDAFDDTLEPAQWIARIVKHLGRAVSQDPDAYRRQLVIVGALAVAGIEAYDRGR